MEPTTPTPTAEDTQPIAVEALRQDMKTINTAVMWLQELKEKIATDGISRHDVQALAAIRETLTDAGFEFDAVPALEKYTPASFTDERSSVNLDAGLEGISNTIMQTIKRWIKKLIDYIRDVVRWYRKHTQNETAVQAKLTRLRDAINKTSAASEEIATRYVKVDERAFMMDLVERWKKQLAESKLEYRTETLAALGNPDALGEMHYLEHQMKALPTQFLNMATELKTFMLADDADSVADVTIDFQVFNDINQTKLITERMNRVRPGKKIMEHHDARKSYYAFLTKAGGFRLQRTLVEVTPFEHIYKAFEDTSDALREIEREVDVVSGTDDVVKILNRFSQGVDELGQIASFLYSHNNTKLKVLKMITDYENYRFTRLYRQAMDNAGTKMQTQAVERIKAKVEKFLRDIMH